jgi:hypothetical protein
VVDNQLRQIGVGDAAALITDDQGRGSGCSFRMGIDHVTQSPQRGPVGDRRHGVHRLRASAGVREIVDLWRRVVDLRIAGRLALACSATQGHA